MLVDAREFAGDAMYRSTPPRILGVRNPEGDAIDIGSCVLAVATETAALEPAEPDPAEPAESEVLEALTVVGLGGAEGGAGLSRCCLGV